MNNIATPSKDIGDSLRQGQAASNFIAKPELRTKYLKLNLLLIACLLTSAAIRNSSRLSILGVGSLMMYALEIGGVFIYRRTF